MNPFIYNPDQYTRQTDILPAYIQDSALYLSRMLNKPLEACVQFVTEQMRPGGLAPLHDPEVLFLQRQKNGDRKRQTTRLTEYLTLVRERQFILVPTMTVYLNPNQRESYNAKYIAVNLRKRKTFKKAMFDAKMRKDETQEAYYNILQNSTKIKNNSVSGAHASPSTILYNKSSHSTLTSTCRISTSYANANNEWYLAGNRHYWCPQVVLVTLLSACRHTDFDALRVAVERYSLVIPTTPMVMEAIERSTCHYWDNPVALKEIEGFVDTMLPLEKAAFLYNCDLFHLAKHNPALVRQVLEAFSTPGTMPSADPDASFAQVDSDQLTLVVLLCAPLLDGRSLTGAGGVKESDPAAYAMIAGTADRVRELVEEYTPLIHGLWRPSILPPSIAVLPHIIRRVVVASDTDSTIFTNQHWAEWMTDGSLFSEQAYRVGYVTTYFTSQLVKHKLALMSANVGIVTKHIHRISMKNEYYFPVFSLTPVAKHYYAFRSAQEGNVFKEMETEIKGVHLRDSSAPVHVTKLLKHYMETTMQAIIDRGQLSLHEVLAPVATLELSIMQAVREGSYLYTKSAQIKDPSSYVQGTASPNYQHYLMWNEVFGPKYGTVVEPPYAAAKVSVDLDSTRTLQTWLSTMDDQELANRMRHWLERHKKVGITTFILPMPVLQVRGIPKEITDAIDLRKLVKNIVSPFYLVLESFGLYMSNDNITRLVSDTFNPALPTP
jgi:hypothetical protein